MEKPMPACASPGLFLIQAFTLRVHLSLFSLWTSAFRVAYKRVRSPLSLLWHFKNTGRRRAECPPPARSRRRRVILFRNINPFTAHNQRPAHKGALCSKSGLILPQAIDIYLHLPYNGNQRAISVISLEVAFDNSNGFKQMTQAFCPLHAFFVSLSLCLLQCHFSLRYFL